MYVGNTSLKSLINLSKATFNKTKPIKIYAQLVLLNFPNNFLTGFFYKVLFMRRQCDNRM